MITEPSIQQIRDLPIMDIIERYPVKFRQKGKTACCPFHNENTPSFHVHQAKGIFKCFGCGVSGDGIAFVMRIDNLDFIGAVERIAGLLRIELEYTKDYDKEAYKKQREERKSYREILQQAQDWFVQKLHKSQAPLQYLQEKRGYNLDTMLKWGLGWGGDEWRELTEALKQKTDLPSLVKLSLSVEQEQGRARDNFMRRITFPLRDEYGELVGFAGRVITKEEEDKYKKYKNSDVNPLYKKSATLFGLYEAKPAIKKLGYAVIVEGYTDVISMHAAGAENAVGTGGTALTEEQCRILKRLTNTIVIWRDNDKAGLKAVSSDMEKLIGLGFRVEVIIAGEDGNDPDNIARQYFPEPVKEEVESE